MQEFMRLKYLSVTKILSPNLKSARLPLSYLNSFYRLWPIRPRAETTHLENGPKRHRAETTRIRREQSSLSFFYKIHSGTVSLDKDTYLTPAPNLKRTRTSHDSQYTRYFAYSDALKNSFFPRTIPLWNTSSLPSSVVSSKTTEEFKGLI